ncbi:MAG: Hsp20/alpha crystallin family protein [Pseudomonadota bacterium]
MTQTHSPSDNGHPAASVQTRAETSPFRALHDEMDKFLSTLSFPNIAWGGRDASAAGTLGLRVDIAETDKAIEVKADLPGIDEKDVEVMLDGDILRLTATTSHDDERKERNWHVRERAVGTFNRAIRVPQGIKPEAVEAHFERGVLTITLPKPANGSGAKQIKVKAR